MYDQSPPHIKKNNNVLWIILAVLAVCGCGGAVVLAAILFPVFEQAKVAATKTVALSHTKQAALGVIMYSADNNDFLPPGNQWMDKTLPYTKNEDVFKSPAVVKENPGAYGFAFRQELSGVDSVRIETPNETAMVFDSTIITRNATSGLNTLPDPPRYGSSNMIGFADGHAKATTKEGAMRLNPKVPLLPAK